MLATIERGASLPGEGQLPLAPILHADDTAALVSVILLFAGFGACLVWALVKWLRDREALPTVLVVAGLIACNTEPVGDYVGQIVYAVDIPWFDYWVLGHQMPSFIAVGFASYVALGGYYAARFIGEGRSLRDIAIACIVAIGIPEIVTEMLWHHWEIIGYYGENPTRVLGIPLYSIVQNSTILPVYGVAVYLGSRYLKGAQILWMILAMPTLTMGYIVGVSWPVYQAIGSSADAWVVWVAATWTVVASIAIAYGALQIPVIRDLREQRRFTAPVRERPLGQTAVAG